MCVVSMRKWYWHFFQTSVEVNCVRSEILLVFVNDFPLHYRSLLCCFFCLKTKWEFNLPTSPNDSNSICKAVPQLLPARVHTKWLEEQLPPLKPKDYEWKLSPLEISWIRSCSSISLTRSNKRQMYWQSNTTTLIWEQSFPKKLILLLILLLNWRSWWG